MCNDFQIASHKEVNGVNFLAILSWDFDNWCLDGFFAVKGTFNSDKEIFNLIYGNLDELEEWEENTYTAPSDLVRECTDEEIDLHFSDFLES